MGEKDEEAVFELKRLAKVRLRQEGHVARPARLGRDRPVAAPDGKEDDQRRERYAHGADGRLGTAGGVAREDGEAGRGGERGADPHARESLLAPSGVRLRRWTALSGEQVLLTIIFAPARRDMTLASASTGGAGRSRCNPFPLRVALRQLTLNAILNRSDYRRHRTASRRTKWQGTASPTPSSKSRRGRRQARPRR